MVGAPPTEDDLDFVAEMFADPRMTRTLGGPRDGTRVVADLERWRTHWDTYGFGLWILRRRDTGAPVGWTMLTATDTGGPAGVEVGWSVAADRWRQGLATEAGAEAVRIAFVDLGLDALVSLTLPHNAASRGVMEKLGFRYDADVAHAGLPHVLYRLTREDWERRHG